MKIVRMAFLVWGTLSLWSACFAQDPFTLKIALSSYRGPVEPLDRTFKVQERYPSSFQVFVINTSSSPQPFYEHDSSGEYSRISFEITDENGRSNVVRKKLSNRSTLSPSFKYMQSGEKRVFDILIEDGAWENAYKLYKQGARKCKVRAIYDNNGSNIYSEYYVLQVVDSSSEQETRESSKSNPSSGSSVLVSN
jgi:hypothetical protein